MRFSRSKHGGKPAPAERDLMSRAWLPGYGRGMNFVTSIIKGVIIAKVIQELSKPENQRKIKDGIRKVSQAGGR